MLSKLKAFYQRNQDKFKHAIGGTIAMALVLILPDGWDGLAASLLVAYIREYTQNGDEPNPIKWKPDSQIDFPATFIIAFIFVTLAKNFHWFGL